MRFLVLTGFLAALMCGLSFARSLNYYIIHSTAVTVLERTSLKSLEFLDRRDALNTKIFLDPKCTDYIITNIEPENAPARVRQFFNLYQSYEFDDRTDPLATDNSGRFDVNKDWSVQVSCPTGK